MKKFKQISKVLIAVSLVTVSAFALLKTGVLGKEKNALIVDPNARYDIVADLDGGKFEPGSKPEFVKMDNGKWLYKYKPTVSITKIPKPVKDGYTFEGWLVGNDQTPKPEYSIPAWNKKNISLTAKWKVTESMLVDGLTFNELFKCTRDWEYITEIKFIKGSPDPNGVDLSVAHDGSITGKRVGDSYVVSCAGTIYANPDCELMFFRLGRVDYNKTMLSAITFENFNTSKVTNMREMFDIVEINDIDGNLKYINGLNKFDTSNVTDMCNMFRSCSLVKDIDVSSFDTSKVTNMFCMFKGCESVETLDVSSFDTSKVVNMTGMFSVKWVNGSMEFGKPMGLRSIKGINNFDLSSAKRLDAMFSGCNTLQELDLSGFNLSNVDSTANMFDGCWELKTINGLEKFNMRNISDATEMFLGCDKLSGEITITNPSMNTKSMFETCSTDKDTLFVVKYNNECKNLVKDTLSKAESFFRHVYMYGEDYILDTGNRFNKAITSMAGFNSVRHIKFVKGNPKAGKELGRRFPSCTENNGSVTTTPMSQEYLQVTCNPCAIKGNIEGDTLYISAVGNGNIKANPDCSGIFEGMSNIESITFENFDTSNVSNMTRMFDGCANLQNLDLSGFDTSRVENMKAMFFGCNKLDSVNLSRFNTSNVTSMQAMFGYCYTLNTLDLNNFTTSKVTNMHQMFVRCGLLESIKGIEKFDLSSVTDSSMMFQFCKNLSGEITIPGVITTYNQMFHGCSSNHNTQFIVKYTQASKDFVKELLKPALNNIAKHVYLYENTYALRSGKEFNDKIKAIPELNAVKHIKFIKNSPIGGVNLGEDNYNVDKDPGLDLPTPVEDKCLGCAIKGNIKGDTLYISAVGNGNITANPDCSGMFEGMSNIESITFENFDMSQITNMSRMFKNCSKLSGEMTIDKSIASYQEMFLGCSSDTNAEFWVKYISPETKNVAKGMIETKREGVDHVYLYESNVLVPGIEFNNILKTHFQNNENGIKTIKFIKDAPKPGGIDFSDKGDKSIMGNLENDILIIRCATQIEANPDCSNMFNPLYNNYMPNFRLGGIEFNNFYTQNVVNMESMFEGLHFDNIDLSKFNTSRVTNMSNMFKFTGFINLDLTSFDTSKVTNMSGMFEDSEDLKAINLSSFDTSNVTDMTGMFSKCRMLNELRLENFNTQNVKSMKAMFVACESLTNLDLRTFDTDSVTDISYMFSSCSELQNLDVCNFNTRNVIDMKSVFYYCKKLTSLDLSNWDTGNVEYMDSMFDYCLNLKTIGENNFTFKNVTDMSYMFRSCNNLTGKITFDFPDIPSTGGFAPHVSCEYMFNSCSTNSETQFIIDYTNNYSRFVAEYVAGGGNVKIRDRYRITYDFDSGSFMDTKRYDHYYSYEGLTVPTPYKEGYNFIGWTGSNGSVPQENIKIKIGETGDRHYIANWEPKYSGSESPNVFTRFKSFTKTQSANPVKLTLINGPSAQYPKQVIQITNNKIPNLSAPDLNPLYAGQFGGYYYDEQFTKPVKQGDIITRDLTIYARW